MQLPTQTGIHSRSRASLKNPGTQIFFKTPEKKKSQLAKVIIWHQVCFQPNACLAFFDSPLSCFVPSLLNSAPSSSPTCVTNWPESIWSLKYLKIFSPIKSDLTTVTGSQGNLRLTLACCANKCVQTLHWPMILTGTSVPKMQ